MPFRKDYPTVLTKSGRKVPVRDLLALDQSRLELEYEIQSPWSAVIQDICTSLQIKVDRLERRIDSLEAKKFLHYRASLQVGPRPPSNEVVKANVAVDADVEALYEEFFAAREDYEAAAAVRLAFTTRKDMLINLGAEVRLSRKGS